MGGPATETGAGAGSALADAGSNGNNGAGAADTGNGNATSTGAAGAGAGTDMGASGAGNALAADSGGTVVPEKFHVYQADGKTLDVQKTLEKVTASYSQLERRMPSYEPPPEREDGYKLDYKALPQTIKLTPEGEKTFLKSMHAAGMSNSQVQKVVDFYGALLDAGAQLQQTNAQAGVIEVETVLKDALPDAKRGFNALASEEVKANAARLGYDAKLTYRAYMELLAKVGEGLKEDPGINGGEGVDETTLEELKKSEAYLKKDHPDHKATVEKVTRAYERKYAAKK